MKPVRNIPNNLRMNANSLAFGKLIVVVFAKRLPAFLVSLDSKFEKFIVGCFASIELIKDSLLLVFRRVQAITIQPNLHIEVMLQ